MAPDYEQILYEVDDGVVTITLNRPEKLNAMTAQMGAEMGDAMAEADGDDAVRVVVLTGAGRGFCAGADLGAGKEFAGGWGGVEREYRRMMPMEVRKPVIAAINGPAVGAGLTWPLQADIRYVATDAKLAFAFVRRGVLPELASHITRVEREHPVRVAIDGVDAAGKTTLADELVAPLERAGRQVVRASIDGFHHPEAIRRRRGSLSAEGYYRDSFDHATLAEELLLPLGPGGDRRPAPGPNIENHIEVIACSRSPTSRSSTTRSSSCCAASRSTSPMARSSPCSAPTAPARRPRRGP